MNGDKTQPEKSGDNPGAIPPSVTGEVLGALEDALPKPPGTQKKKPPMSEPEPETPPVTVATPVVPEPNKKKSNNAFFIGTIVLVSLLLVFAVILLKPAKQKPINAEISEDANSLLQKIQGLSIQIRAYKAELESTKTEMDLLKQKFSLLEGQTKMAIDKTAALEISSKENRSYISTIYRQTLDLQLKLDAIGGGYTPPKKEDPESRTVNPFIGGSENLP